VNLQLVDQPVRIVSWLVRRSCKVYKNLGVGGRKDRARWEAIQDAMIEAMIRLHGAIDPMLRGLPAA
jgi:hypothetical protein